MPIEDALVGAQGQVPWQNGNILDCWQLIDGDPYQHLLVADVYQQSVVQFQ
jgi:hypothetical protein